MREKEKEKEREKEPSSGLIPGLAFPLTLEGEALHGKIPSRPEERNRRASSTTETGATCNFIWMNEAAARNRKEDWNLKDGLARLPIGGNAELSKVHGEWGVAIVSALAQTTSRHLRGSALDCVAEGFDSLNCHDLKISAAKRPGSSRRCIHFDRCQAYFR